MLDSSERAKSSPSAAEETLAFGCGLNENINVQNSDFKVIPHGSVTGEF
jgi:hypothetical protein